MCYALPQGKELDYLPKEAHKELKAHNSKWWRDTYTTNSHILL